jgi:cobalt-precorrin-5B (C1)-methyltransferase
MARTGYTLPVFAVAAAKAALLHLIDRPIDSANGLTTVELDLLPDPATIAIDRVAKLDADSALAITISDPGDNLDLTRGMPIWARVELIDRTSEPLILLAGEGVGKSLTGEPAIYQYARKLFAANLEPLCPNDRTIRISIIMPDGKVLAERTSNAAFGIVEGLSLLGTSGISQPLSTEEHLDSLRDKLQLAASAHTALTYCIGSNGIQTATRLGIDPATIVQTGNWVGAMLLYGALAGVERVTLLGYQGKLIKLAGGIFNTSSHLADAKLEIVTAAALHCGASSEGAIELLAAKTADRAYQILQAKDLASPTFDRLARSIATKATAYVRKYADKDLSIDVTLTDRLGNVIATCG